MFDEVRNFLASNDIKVLVAPTYLFAMQFLVGLTLFCTQVVLFSMRITNFVSDNEDFVLSLAIYVYYCIANKFGTTSMQAEK